MKIKLTQVKYLDVETEHNEFILAFMKKCIQNEAELQLENSQEWTDSKTNKKVQYFVDKIETTIEEIK